MLNIQVGKLLCYCGAMHDIMTEDLGFSEHVCPRCFQTLPVPEYPHEFTAQNKAVQEEIDRVKYSGYVRVVAIQETGEELVLADRLKESDTELISAAVVGFTMVHPEYKAIFTEPVLRQGYEVAQFILDEN